MSSMTWNSTTTTTTTTTGIAATPEDVMVQHIFRQLPGYSLVACSLVNKSWQKCCYRVLLILKQEKEAALLQAGVCIDALQKIVTPNQQQQQQQQQKNKQEAVLESLFESGVGVECLEWFGKQLHFPVRLMMSTEEGEGTNGSSSRSYRLYSLFEECLGHAARGGHLHLLKWASANGCELDSYTCSCAAAGGHLEVLKWLRANGCKWGSSTCSSAARYGHHELLQWARENGCPWRADTCFEAAREGHLEVLKWARANGCPWNAKTCAYAAEGGHLEVLKWARANGCDWDCAWTCRSAALHGHLEVLKWARDNGCSAE